MKSLFILCLGLSFFSARAADRIPSMPFLYGAELQYFRARGGSERNVPAAVVKAGWEKLLDRFAEAKMNTAIFYIPWDFHEPTPGKFDFDGTLDQDGDGNPDYPSRNLKLFFRMLQQRGVKHLMVRPGPYINAEWGPEGFGAVPKWFLDGYPDALAKTQTPGKPRVVTFAHPEFQARVRTWFQTLHREVLRDWIGPGKPVDFLQIDNETNFFWDSVYERDWSPLAQARYRAYVKRRYGSNPIALRRSYGPAADFETLPAPRALTDHRFGPQWHYDWAAFHDDEILQHHVFVKNLWRDLGVTDTVVQFTTCDSFNALNGGMLPRLDLRQRGRLSLATMNIYPKTFGSASDSTLNQPMKAAHDVQVFAAAQRQYYGARNPWVMASETMGGWFPPVEVSMAARQHTYGSLLGAGVKALIIYYFHEGWNWSGNEKNDTELQFDAPLDKDLNPRASFALIKSLGEALEAGLGRSLRHATSEAPILIAHDSHAQYSVVPGKDVQTQASTNSAALFGLLREAGYSTEAGFLDAMTLGELNQYRAIWFEPRGYLSAHAQALLQAYVKAGGALFTVGPSAMAGPNVHALRADLAKGWNDDSYATRPSQAPLLEVRRAMARVIPNHPVGIANQDGQDKLHFSVRRNGSEWLLFVENFIAKPRRATLTMNQMFPSGRTFALDSVWGTTAKAQKVRADRAGNLVADVDLPPDSVTIWRLKPDLKP